MPEVPALDAHRLGLVVQIVLDAGAGQDVDASRQCVQERVVGLELRGLLVPVPVGLEGDLRDVALIGPEGSDLLAARRRCPVRQDHLRVFGVDAVEQVPDEVMIVEARSRAEGDQRAGGDQHLLFGPLSRIDEIRSEEHTSELQSLMRISYAVFCLTKKPIYYTHTRDKA